MTDDEPASDSHGADGRLVQALRRAALAHVERYASSEDGLRRVLERRVLRWMRDPERGLALEPTEIARLVDGAVGHCRSLGLLDDRAFAESKLAVGRRKGHSTRRIAATLAAKGIDPTLAADVLAEDGTDEATAALVFARRMRLGPFRTRPAADPAAADRRDLAALCRNGHGYGAARRVIGLDRDRAEAILAGESDATDTFG